MNWDEANPATLNGFDPNRHAMIQVYQKFGLAEATIDFIGHAVALRTSDAYFRQPCGLTSNKCKLYVDFFMQYDSFMQRGRGFRDRELRPGVALRERHECCPSR